MISAFISPSDALEKQNHSQTIFVDATYGQPVEYSIPNAVHFDIDDIADTQSSYAHTLPNSDYFSNKVSTLGIGNDDEIIVFDRNGFWMAAARVWWMFRVFGHTNIRIMNGGLSNWQGKLVPYTKAVQEVKNFTAQYNPTLYKSYADIVKNNEDFLIVDARPAQAYEAGHIPNSINVPLPSIINNDATIKSRMELELILKPALDKDVALVTSCGSGVTACALASAFYECGKDNVAVFDGSWTEWRSRQDSNLQPTA